MVYIVVIKSEINKIKTIVSYYNVVCIVFVIKSDRNKLKLLSVIITYAVVCMFVKFVEFMEYKWLMENGPLEFTNGS